MHFISRRAETLLLFAMRARANTTSRAISRAALDDYKLGLYHALSKKRAAPMPSKSAAAVGHHAVTGISRWVELPGH